MASAPYWEATGSRTTPRAHIGEGVLDRGPEAGKESANAAGPGFLITHGHHMPGDEPYQSEPDHDQQANAHEDHGHAGATGGGVVGLDLAGRYCPASLVRRFGLILHSLELVEEQEVVVPLALEVLPLLGSQGGIRIEGGVAVEERVHGPEV